MLPSEIAQTWHERWSQEADRIVKRSPSVSPRSPALHAAKQQQFDGKQYGKVNYTALLLEQEEEERDSTRRLAEYQQLVDTAAPPKSPRVGGISTHSSPVRNNPIAAGVALPKLECTEPLWMRKTVSRSPPKSRERSVANERAADGTAPAQKSPRNSTSRSPTRSPVRGSDPDIFPGSEDVKLARLEVAKRQFFDKGGKVDYASLVRDQLDEELGYEQAFKEHKARMRQLGLD
eukprot:TRINITY_DN84343_c0_g1_i1.p1 TRINITY_DN84343_c0_g1~~TRINITY_DN84343_c0_g1_i1.p1  ORF type:complete len:233 (+),score=33.86 TRINITY_DN84343_c0_g1_i1:45-743(+)